MVANNYIIQLHIEIPCLKDFWQSWLLWTAAPSRERIDQDFDVNLERTIVVGSNAELGRPYG